MSWFKASGILICYYATMDRGMQLRHLEEAERHVAQGERIIAEQEGRIANLAQLEHDTAQARKLLDSFYEIQVHHVYHRDRIRNEIERSRLG